jgi:hypothetical protein
MTLEKIITKYDSLKNEALQTLFFLTTRKEYNENSIKECNQIYMNYINICDVLIKSQQDKYNLNNISSK